MFNRWIKNGEETQDIAPGEGKKILERMESLLTRSVEHRHDKNAPLSGPDGDSAPDPAETVSRDTGTGEGRQIGMVTGTETYPAAAPGALVTEPRQDEQPATTTPALTAHTGEPEAETKPVLPIQAPRQAAMPAAAAPPEAKPNTGKTAPLILVVEDEPVTQMMIQSIFKKRGYDTVLAADGIDALMHIGRTEFDLILSDLSMPNCDGFKLVEYLNQKKIAVPVMFLTASDDVEDEIRCLALGARDFVKKPINGDLLLLRTSRILKGAAA